MLPNKYVLKSVTTNWIFHPQKSGVFIHKNWDFSSKKLGFFIHTNGLHEFLTLYEKKKFGKKLCFFWGWLNLSFFL
jgi:hypothetical protein